MIEAALLLAIFLHRPPELVLDVYIAGGIDAVAVVWMESQFNPRALRREPGGTSWGLFQLYDRYHPQHRDNLTLHIAEGAAFLEKCKEKAAKVHAESAFKVDAPAGSGMRVRSPEGPFDSALCSDVFATAVSFYNSWTPTGSKAWGERVKRERDRLEWWLLRRMR